MKPRIAPRSKFCAFTPAAVTSNPSTAKARNTLFQIFIVALPFVVRF
jgi:hypothetical protein